MDDRHRRSPDASGFEFSRRTVLKAGGALALSSAFAGCNETDDPTPTEPLDPQTDFVDDDLEIVSSSFVRSQGTWTDPSATLPDSVSRNALRVLVRNTTQTPIQMVSVSVECYDDDLEFLGIQSASISSLLSQEVFEGYLPYVYEETAAYVLRAEGSTRAGGDEALSAVTVTDDCIANQRVEGRIDNSFAAVDRLRVLVRFYDADGHVLGTGSDTITGLGASSFAEFSVDMNAAIEDGVETVDSYSVSVGDFDGETLAVR